jgi:cysteine desulfurase
MIYLDNNATTPLDPRVLSAMHLDLSPLPYNPSSVTFFGRKAKAMLIDARRSIAASLSVMPNELYFTSGATEANHWMIKGFFEKRKKKVVITSRIEHPSARLPIENLGALIHYLPITEEGRPCMKELQLYLEKERDQVAFIFLSLANSETGVVLDYEHCAEIALRYGIPLLLDGVQALGKIDFSLLPGISAMSFSAHKCHGPKGIGLLYLREGKVIAPLFQGGHQQEGMRAGTENLSGILGFAKAIDLVDKKNIPSMQTLVTYLEEELQKTHPLMKIHGKGRKIANTTHLYFPGIDGENLLILLEQEGVIVSLGSACASGSLEPSPTLLGMGYPLEEAKNSVRISLSRMTTKEEIDRAIPIIKKYIFLK